MKKALLLCGFMFIGLFSQAQVSDEQYSLVTKISADWCPNCGNWAWDAFEDMRSTLEDKKVIFVLAHHTGGLENSVSGPWCENLENQYQPEFFLNNDFQNMNGNTAASVTASMGEQIDLLADLGTFAGVEGKGYTTSDENKLFADVSVEFFSEIEGEYFLGVYTIQNNILWNQSGQGMVMQPRLLTGSFTEDWYGMPINGTTGQQDFTFEMARPSDFDAENGNTEILTVIWNKLPSGQYLVFNANVNNEIESVSSNDEVEVKLSGIKTYLQEEELILSLKEVNLDVLQVNIVDVVGKSILKKQFNQNDLQASNLSLDVSQLNTGFYFVQMESKNSKWTTKIYK